MEKYEDIEKDAFDAFDAFDMPNMITVKKRQKHKIISQKKEIMY